MTTSTGGWSQRTSPSSTSAAAPLRLSDLTILIVTGVVIVILHEAIKYPMRIPGQHGLEAMALLAFARMSSENRWAATIAAASAAGAAGLIGSGHDLTTPFLYLLPGLALDVFCLGFPFWRKQLLMLPFFAAAAFMLKPVVRLGLVEAFGMEFGSFRYGPLYPFATHIAFGFAGALIAVLAWSCWDRRNRNQP